MNEIDNFQLLCHSINDCKPTTGTVDKWKIGSLHDIIRFYCRLIADACSEILFTTSYWEGHSVSAFMLCSAITIAVERRNVRVLLIVDNGNILNLVKNNRKLSFNEISQLGFTDKMSDKIRVRSVHVPLFGTIHAKFMVIDRSLAVISSNNVQDRPNLEIALSLTGDIVSGFTDVFNKLWSKGNKDGFPKMKARIDTALPLYNKEFHKMLFANRPAYGGFMRDIICSQNQAWLALLDMAKEKILICTPTLNVEPIIDKILRACRRGVQVHIILTKNFNNQKEALPFQGGTNQNIIQNLTRRLSVEKKQEFLHVHWYIPITDRDKVVIKNCHIKYMSIDGKMCMFGNGNMDTQSWYHSMEVNVIIDNSNLTNELDNELDVDYR